MDTSHSYGGPGPSGAVRHASLQHNSGSPHGICHSGVNKGCQEQQTSQAQSHSTPPRRQTSFQQVHMSSPHLSEGSNTPTPSPQSQPQRPSPNQQTGSSLRPRIPPAGLPPNKMLLRDHSVSISGTSPPRSRSPMAAGQLPLSLVPSIENRDLSRQPGASSTTPFLSRFGFITVLVVFVLSTLCHSSNGPSIVLGQALMRLLQFSSALAAEDQNVCSLTCSFTNYHKYVYLVVPKTTTLTLDELRRGVLPDISYPQAYVVERQSKNRGKGIRFVLVCAEFLGFILTSTVRQRLVHQPYPDFFSLQVSLALSL
jgi:hypothetical protein